MSQETQNITLLTYKELLTQISESSSNHLLLGNGFNTCLGIKTSYSEIFLKMKTNYPDYQDVENYLEQEKYNIEKLIGHLSEIKSNQNTFLKNFIEKKIKLDFMKAANEIVQKNINRIYHEHNQGIYLLFKNFTKYFTLNYDPFLYLLLMKFKKDEHNDPNAIAFQNTALFQENDLNQKHVNIYEKIKHAKEKGKLTITVDKVETVKLDKMKKTQFISSVKTYFHNEDWKDKDIKLVCDKMWNEETNRPEIDVNDGSQGKIFQEENDMQNLFFLHGALHIMKKGNSIQKITAKQNKSFLEKLEEAIYAEEKDIICVLTDQSEKKKEQINENIYLKKGLNNLSKIKGYLVIFGSSLNENDKHIFDQINKSGIQQIYISCSEEDKKEFFLNANNLFKNKKITLFDYNTLSFKELA